MYAEEACGLSENRKAGRRGSTERNRRRLGAEKEQKAGKYLEDAGYEILEYNYRCRAGEIDIVAKDGNYLVFCEVKYRSGTGSGHPLEAVDFRKQKIISRCALYYLTRGGIQDVPCRFDVVSMTDEEILVVRNA